MLLLDTLNLGNYLFFFGEGGGKPKSRNVELGRNGKAQRLSLSPSARGSRCRAIYIGQRQQLNGSSSGRFRLPFFIAQKLWHPLLLHLPCPRGAETPKRCACRNGKLSTFRLMNPISTPNIVESAGVNPSTTKAARVPSQELFVQVEHTFYVLPPCRTDRLFFINHCSNSDTNHCAIHPPRGRRRRCCNRHVLSSRIVRVFLLSSVP